MKKLNFLVLALSTAFAATQAQAYQSQIDVSYDHYDVDGTGIDAGDFNLQATGYFENIKVKNMPWDEAGFLSQTSNIYGAYNYFFVDEE